MKYKAVLFDLDGTLLDTAPGLARAMNEVLVKYNFPPHSLREYKTYIGNGIKALVDQSVPEDTSPELRDVLYKEKSSLYDQYWKDGTSLFPEIPTMLTALQDKGVKLAIFSNKEDFFTQKIVSAFLGQWHFAVVLGRTSEIPKKPDPTGVNMIVHRLPFESGEWLYVGDKDADMNAANNAPMDFAWASWGYQDEVPLTCAQVLHTPHDIITLLG